MKNLLFFISILLILSFYSSCKKNKAETVLIPQEFKDYTVFPEGSWWVYEEKHTGTKDSVYVYLSECGFTDDCYVGDSRCGVNGDGCYMLSVSRNDTIHHSTRYFASLADGRYMHIYEETNHSKTQTLSNHLLLTPIDSLGQQVPYQGGHIIVALDDTLLVGDTQYFNTISTSTDGVVSEHGGVPFNIKNCIFAKGIGKVYIHYHDGTEWFLKDYFINN